MTKSSVVDSRDDLSAVLQVYSEATERLEVSHDRLMAEVARLSAELVQKNKLLERKRRLEILGEMAAGVAHEIRNPLGGIVLYAGLLERELAECPGSLRLVRSILSGVQSLDAIVGDLLSFTRGFEPAPGRCCLASVVAQALMDAVGDIGRTEIRVQREFADPDVELEADEGLLRRAVLNLVRNAVQAMGREGDLFVRTGAGQGTQAESCWMEVTDTGPGIAPDMETRLFEPYVTNKEGGTGLGLAIVQKIVESHGGRVTAENRDGGGASFRITLPLQPDPVTQGGLGQIGVNEE
ncbi:MAG TPA: ATP-binding protein [Planctomycetota bacterium]|nr:ATP-binding protein [Planctomycetota bacterium]